MRATHLLLALVLLVLPSASSAFAPVLPLHPKICRLNQATVLEASKKGKGKDRVPLLDPPENLWDYLWDWYAAQLPQPLSSQSS